MQVEILGHTFEADILDADFNEKLQDAMAVLAEEMEWIKAGNTGDEAARIRAQCRAVFTCFNTLFGEGTDRRLFGGHCNLRQVMQAFVQLNSALREQREEALELFAAYRPDDR